jgi:hypothetical protein
VIFAINLEVEDFELILNSSSLVAESEDSLYEMISIHFENDAEWFGLLEFIRFDFYRFYVFKISLNGRNNILNIFQRIFGLKSVIGWQSMSATPFIRVFQ